MIKHVVYISREYPPSLRAGGIATYVQEMANILVNNNWKVTVICASEDTRNQSISDENGVDVIRISGGDFFLANVEKKPFWLKRLRFLYRFLSYRYKLYKTIQNLENVSLIEVPEYGAEGLFLLRLKIPLVVRLHTPMLLDRETLSKEKLKFSNFHHYWLGCLEFWIVRKAKNITSCSDALKHWFIKELGIDSSRIKTIYNAITVPKSNKSLHETETRTVFFAGSIQAPKGVGELVEAIQILSKKGYTLNLILAGKMAKYAHDLQKKLRNDNADWCRFLGHLFDRNELIAYYQNVAVCCFPSWWENLPYVCLEAMSVGAIVIGTTKSGFEEIIENNVSGFLCPPQNAILLAETLEKALNLNENQRKIMAKNAIEKIKNKFSEKLVQENINYYHSISIQNNENISH